MQSSQDWLKKAREWASEIDGIAKSRVQLARSGLQWAMLIAMGIGLVILFHGLWLAGSGHSTMASHAFPVLAVAVCFMSFLYARFWYRVESRVLLALMILLCALTVVAVGFNGILPVTLVPALIVFFHVVLTPPMAFVLCLSYLSVELRLAQSTPLV